MEKTKTISTTNYGPTDHSGGNSGANSWASAASHAKQLARTLALGDRIDESIYDLDDQTISELRKSLAVNGLALGELDADGCQIVMADRKR